MRYYFGLLNLSLIKQQKYGLSFFALLQVQKVTFMKEWFYSLSEEIHMEEDRIVVVLGEYISGLNHEEAVFFKNSKELGHERACCSNDLSTVRFFSH